MRILKKIALPALGLTLLAGCGGDDPVPGKGQETPDPNPPFEEPVPEHVVFTHADLSYYGDEGYTEASTHYLLSLYTDMEIDEGGNPIGPGFVMRLSFNADFPEQGAAPALPAGTYAQPADANSYLPFTFNEGYIETIDLPDGPVDLPQLSFFGEVEAGGTAYEPDLLREGYCKVEVDKEGRYTLSGILVGTMFMKRYFSYAGELTAVDRSGGGEPVSSSTLTADLDLTTLKQGRVEDRGDRYYLGDESYRAVTLLLAEQSVDLSEAWPAGVGRLLQVEFFVAWDTDLKEGIPAGSYRMAVRTDTGGFDRADFVPGNIVPGLPGKFTQPEGCWYRMLAESGMPEYACLTGGTMTVTGSGLGSQTLEIDFTDLSETPHHVRCTYAKGVELYERGVISLESRNTRMRNR